MRLSDPENGTRAGECARGSSARGTETGLFSRLSLRGGISPREVLEAAEGGTGTRRRAFPPRLDRKTETEAAEAGADPEARTLAAAKIPENCYKMRKFLPEIFYMIPEIFYIHHRRFSTR